MMSLETFKAWKTMPETKEFFKFLKQEEHSHRLVIAEGVPLTEKTNEKAMNSFIKHLSRADVYNNIINLEYEDLDNVEEDKTNEDKTIRTSSINSPGSD